MSSQSFVDITDIFCIPTHNYTHLMLNRDGKIFRLKVQSLTEVEQDEINKVCKEPIAPLVEEVEKDDKGKVIFDGNGHTIKIKRRDSNDPDYLLKYTDYIKRMLEAITVFGLIIAWDTDPEKAKKATVEQKISILRQKFSAAEIQRIASEIRQLSATSIAELDNEVKK